MRIARKEKITTRLSLDPTKNSQNKLFMKCKADSGEFSSTFSSERVKL